jgi:undecaprenyl-diphosphatase
MKKITKNSIVVRFLAIMGVILISGVIFAALAEDIVDHELFSVMDPILGTWLLGKTTLAGDRIFSAITFLGNAVLISIGTGLLALWMGKTKRWNQMAFLLISVGGGALLNVILKSIFLRPRPFYPHAYLTDTGFSFPSGHAMISITFYGTLTYLAFMLVKSWKKRSFMIVGLLILSILIGFSRLYLGVHYLSDVLAGWSAGGLWLAICIFCDNVAFYKRIRRKNLQSVIPG